MFNSSNGSPGSRGSVGAASTNSSGGGMGGTVRPPTRLLLGGELFTADSPQPLAAAAVLVAGDSSSSARRALLRLFQAPATKPGGIKSPDQQYMQPVPIATTFSVPAPADPATRSRLIRTVANQSPEILSTALSDFFGVPLAVINAAQPTAATGPGKAVSEKPAASAKPPNDSMSVPAQVMEIDQVPPPSPAPKPRAPPPPSPQVQQKSRDLQLPSPRPQKPQPAVVQKQQKEAQQPAKELERVPEAQPTPNLQTALQKIAPGVRTRVQAVSGAPPPSPTPMLNTRWVSEPLDFQGTDSPQAMLSNFGGPIKTELEGLANTLSWKHINSNDFAEAPECPFPPTRSNSVPDKKGRFWSVINSKECVFRPNHAEQAEAPPYTFHTAPECQGAPNDSNSVTDDEGRLWGWQNGVSCAFHNYVAGPQNQGVADNGGSGFQVRLCTKDSTG